MIVALKITVYVGFIVLNCRGNLSCSLSLFISATEVTTAFIFHEPSLLSALQDNGLPGVVLNSIISKPIPVTREVLSSLPSILSAMCLNTRGLQVGVVTSHTPNSPILFLILLSWGRGIPKCTIKYLERDHQLLLFVATP